MIETADVYYVNNNDGLSELTEIVKRGKCCPTCIGQTFNALVNNSFETKSYELRDDASQAGANLLFLYELVEGIDDFGRGCSTPGDCDLSVLMWEEVNSSTFQELCGIVANRDTLDPQVVRIAELVINDVLHGEYREDDDDALAAQTDIEIVREISDRLRQQGGSLNLYEIRDLVKDYFDKGRLALTPFESS